MRGFFLAVAVLALASCNNKTDDATLKVSGTIKNAPDQDVYLEELFFSEKSPAVLDTAKLKNGNFSLETIASEEGLFRLRLERSEAPFFFINDQKDIQLTTDFNKLSVDNIIFNSPANATLRKFLSGIESQRAGLEQQASALQQYPNKVETDSLFAVMQHSYDQKENAYKNYVLNYFDTTSNAVVAMFTLEFTRNIAPDKLEKSVNRLPKRFPNNASIAATVSRYSQMIAQYNSKPHEGGLAPELNMPDTSGKTFALSMLKGKYVLVDFWASWCGPCRGENPNVVAAYNNYKDKNFTVLGVSLDEDKSAWLKAIAADHLTWYHISDLKQWQSAAVKSYGFDGIPYNVLVNPEGKIVATNLRGANLPNKLAEILK